LSTVSNILNWLLAAGYFSMTIEIGYWLLGILKFALPTGGAPENPVRTGFESTRMAILNSVMLIILNTKMCFKVKAIHINDQTA
jgi:hypothetical protein